MPTSALYDSTRRALASRLSEAKESQLDTLAQVRVGVTQSVSAQLAAIARAMPLDTRQVLKETQLDILKIAAFSDGASALPSPEEMQRIAAEVGFSETALYTGRNGSLT